MNELEFNQELDCRGLNCPLPVLKTKKAMDEMAAGDVLKMISTDPGSQNDVTAWAKRTGNEIMSANNEGSDFVYYIKKG
ncbi:MAG: sulfurtransferase TusA family protein [Candidatus Marinimicrobia bacterium]|jgi:tRNA 2-thiouridine synthesizing protein A|nr:sulfurtransferase TusA family protein [Candidatus Neomarinimicrobiota bacterium]|tara:strand:+ start:2657 stop:2893 length:237 start_codon:yes stop_codon:yes gene_type:complete